MILQYSVNTFVSVTFTAGGGGDGTFGGENCCTTGGGGSSTSGGGGVGKIRQDPLTHV